MSEANNGLPFRVIEGKDVDLIEPFPTKELNRLYGWLRRVRTDFGGDESPKSRKETLEYYSAGLAAPNVISWGIVDKYNLTQGKIGTPLVGFVAFEQQGLYNGNIHIALTKKANDDRLIDESIGLVIEDLFERFPKLLRISAFAAQTNWLVKDIAGRTGFKHEGTCEDFYTNHGEPKAVVLYGLTRNRFEELKTQCHSSEQQQSQLPVQSEESSATPLVIVENKEVRPVPGLPLPLRTKTSPST